MREQTHERGRLLALQRSRADPEGVRDLRGRFIVVPIHTRLGGARIGVLGKERQGLRLVVRQSGYDRIAGPVSQVQHHVGGGETLELAVFGGVNRVRASVDTQDERVVSRRHGLSCGAEMKAQIAARDVVIAVGAPMQHSRLETLSSLVGEAHGDHPVVMLRQRTVGRLISRRRDTQSTHVWIADKSLAPVIFDGDNFARQTDFKAGFCRAIGEGLRVERIGPAMKHHRGVPLIRRRGLACGIAHPELRCRWWRFKPEFAGNRP